MSVTKYLCLPGESNQQTQLSGPLLGKEELVGRSELAFMREINMHEPLHQTAACC